jgi:ankyrin repeat protein
MGDYSDEGLARLSGLYGVPVLTMKLNHAIRTGGYGVEDLLNAGASVNAPNLTGGTPLHTAAEVGNTYLVEKLLEKGAIVNARDELGKTPLHYASQYVSPAIADILLKHGANVNAADINGVTPLHHAVRFGRLKTVELLLFHGADPGAKTNDTNRGLTPLHIAGDMGNREMAVRMLVKRPEAAQITDDVGNVPRVFPGGDPRMEHMQWHVGNIATTVAPKEAADRRLGLAALIYRRNAEAQEIAKEYERGAPARIARAAVERERANDAAAAAARAEAAGKKYEGDEFIYPAKAAPKGGRRLQRRGRKTVKARKAMKRKRKTMRRR